MRRFRLRTIKYKVFLLLLALIVVPFLLYTAIVVTSISRQMETLGFHSADQVLTQTANFVDSRVDLVKRALDLLTLNTALRDLSAADPAPYDRDPGMWIRDTAVLMKIEDSVGQNNPDIRSFALYTVGGLGASKFHDESPQFLALRDQEGSDWFRALNGSDNLPQWFAPEVRFDHAISDDLHVLRRIPDDQNLQTTVGWARANVKLRGFEDILDNAEFSSDTVAFLAAGRSVVARSVHAKGIDVRALVELTSAPPQPWTVASVAGTLYRVARRPVGQTGWDLFMAIPNRDIGAFGDKARNMLFLVLALILPLMVPLSFGAASSSTRRIGTLLGGVRRLGEGSFDVVLPEEGSDEISELTRSFNSMVGQIRDLVEERYRLGLEVKNLELRALQAQINPHFLYNSLDLINGLALLAGQPRIVEAVAALSRFYRLSLSGGAEAIPLSQEMDHAASYAQIQNLRFEDAVELRIEMENGLADVPVLKTILQPLVENAILHGILEKPDERGRVVIRAKTDDEGRLLLEVEDDGVGMDPAILPGLLSREPSTPGPDGHGYGVFNIDRRLRLRYGEASGLRFARATGQGTLVQIRIPMPRES
jgi:two-component system, sensor histidine kinase YesM